MPTCCGVAFVVEQRSSAAAAAVAAEAESARGRRSRLGAKIGNGAPAMARWPHCRKKERLRRDAREEEGAGPGVEEVWDTV
mmetsp:Transcript_41999/g.94677  ORF Transcript_41999/g.94677 Transcript_41999/m.94677 type:complete len:81 (+) Transcript_41999:281-523(+)